jgi:FtsH-binding integral membrane protein
MYAEANEPLLKDEQDKEMNDFELEASIKEKIREGFISKVYGIIAYQVVITSIVIYFSLVSPWFRNLLLKSFTLYITNIFLTFFLLLLPLCYRDSYRIVPLNYIILTIFTISYSCLIAMEVCLYSFTSIMVALFLTFVTVISLTIYAWKTEKDFTIYGGTLFVSLILLLFASLILIFIDIPLLNVIYTYISLIIFCIYLIYDTQLLIGSGRYKFTEDDYILAAISIYLDIIILFLKILSIVGKKE